MTISTETSSRSAAADPGASRFFDSLEDFLLGRGSFGAVLGVTPEQIAALVALGDRLLLSGRAEGALALYEGVQALDPTYTEIADRLALCHQSG